jgi:hypothetical protein
MQRDLSHYDIIALFIDDKSFAEDEMILALGETKYVSKYIHTIKERVEIEIN